QHDASQRLIKLEDFRKNKKEENSKIASDSSNINSSKKSENDELEKKKIAEDEKKKQLIQKKKLEQEKAERLAKIEKRKKELEEKKLARKAEQERRKAERLAKIEKRKKEQEEKKLARKAEQERRKAERLAKIEEKKRLNKIKKEISNQNKNTKKLKIEQNENVNKELKVIYADTEIVKKELLPNINLSGNIDYEINREFNLDTVKNLLASNSNLLIVIPKDFDSFSTVNSEENLTSQMVAGSRSVPNPEFNRLQAEMRRTERELQRAQAEAERGFQMSQCISCGLITQWGGIALQEKWQNEGAKLQNKLNNLISSYSNTPDYLEKEMLRSYSYLVQNVKAEKKAIYQIVQFKNKKLIEKNISIKSNKDFKVAYNIDPQDKKYENLLNKYSSPEQISNWQNQKIKNISLNEFLNLIDNESEFRELFDKKELYASLNFSIEEELSWWEKLLGGSKSNSNKKTASLTNKSSSNYEQKDARFDSVVIVKTEKGLGSGFFISRDEIITNYHVIENAMSISVTDKFKKRSSAVVVKKDLKRDLALLKTNTTGKPVTFYDGQLKQGEMVEALGHPKGRKFSLTKGWISAIRKESSVYSATGNADVLFIQTDAAINPGNSGGPLFFKDKVVGVNTQGLHKDVSEGMNFAVHFSEVNQFLAE
ncbi:S1C family serine protease, partial [Candidatus Pelagibacter communis]|uniref:S1C family serine protease n=1 Tax=Pelagibacter ubique TaxID=198252 RepID=UPI000A8B3080